MPILIEEIAAIVAIVVAVVGLGIWILRLEWRVRDLENNSVIKAFKDWVGTEGFTNFLNDQLSKTNLEKNVKREKPKND